MLIEAIRIVDHPQLDEYPEHWVIDATRCPDHAIDEIVEPTRGFEEALIRVPVSTSNDVVSVSTHESDDLPVLAVSPATEGCRLMAIDQQFMAAVEPDDHGVSRWTRVIGMLDAEPPAPVREHIER